MHTVRQEGKCFGFQANGDTYVTYGPLYIGGVWSKTVLLCLARHSYW